MFRDSETRRENFPPLGWDPDYLNEFEDGEGGGALVGVNAAQDAVELRVEAAVAESEQEAAQQSDGHAGGGRKRREKLGASQLGISSSSSSSSSSCSHLGVR